MPTQIPIDTFIGNDKDIINWDIVNLDGIEPEEILVSYKWIEEKSSYFLYAFDVFAHSQENGWQNALHITTFENSCGIYFGDYGIVNLFDDNTRQVVLWLNCGTGAWLEFEVYKYRGIGFLERLYRNPKAEFASTDNANNWMESLIYINNENLIISKPDGLYKFGWKIDLQQPTMERIPAESLGSNYVIVTYWLNDSGQPEASPTSVELQLGQCIFMQKDDPHNKIWDARLFLYGDIWGSKMCTNKVGSGHVTLWGYEDKPLVSVTVKSPP